MRVLSVLFFALIVGVLAWTLLPVSSAGASPALGSSVAATPAFLPLTAGLFLPPPVCAPAPVLGIGSSVIPPAPAPGTDCSVIAAGSVCSALITFDRCSALNSNANRCSVIAGANTNCSVAATGGACTVLPPAGSAPGSFCSVATVDFNARCSAFSTSNNQKCSVKLSGSSQCSASSQEPINACSVFNVGATSNSFCSTKFNQPTVAKLCSTFSGGASCSIELGGKGICTSFGMALPASCSAFAAGAHCSVIGGAAGNPCVQ